MNEGMGFKLPVTATPGFHSLYDCCYQTMWLFSGAFEDPEDNTVREKHVAETLYSAVKGLVHAIPTKNVEAQQDAAYQMIPIAQLGMIRWWSESELPNGNPPIRIPNDNIPLIDLEWIEEDQDHLMTMVERYTAGGASGAWRVHT